jgi:hypothetical protein
MSPRAHTADMDVMRTAAAVLLVLLPSGAAAALVTRAAPAPEIGAYTALPAILRDLPEADPCAAADKAVYALESSIVEIQAQFWAYLMRQPNFSIRRLPLKPGAEITHPEVKTLFYRKLAAWDTMENIPSPTAESIDEINDVSMRIRLVKDLCAATGV